MSGIDLGHGEYTPGEFKRRISVDFETTGRTPGFRHGGVQPDGSILESQRVYARVWSAGAHSVGSDDYIESVHHHSPSGIAKEAESLSHVDFYAKNEEWQKYIKSPLHTEDNTSSANVIKGLDRITKEAKGKLGLNEDAGVAYLFQNMNFENKFIHGLILSDDANRMIPEISREQMYQTVTHKYPMSDIYVPPSIKKIKDHIAESKDKDPKKIASAYRVMLETYKREYSKAVGSGRSINIELMDMTAAAYSHAVAGGLIPEEYMSLGKNMEFLSKVFLGETEIHGAGSDARQQNAVFDKLESFLHDVTTGNHSDETKRVLGILNDKHVLGANKERAAARSFLNIREALKERDFSAIRKPGELPRTIDITDTTNNKNIELLTQNMVPVKTSDEALEQYRKILESHKNTETYRIVSDIFKKEDDGLYQSSEGMLVNDDIFARISKIEEDADSVINSIGKNGPTKQYSFADEFAEKIKNFDPTTKGFVGRTAERLGSEYEKAKASSTILDAILPESKVHGAIGLGAMTVVGGTWFAGRINDEERAAEFKKRKEDRDSRLYADNTFSMLGTQSTTNIEVPHGWARAQSQSKVRNYEF